MDIFEFCETYNVEVTFDHDKVDNTKKIRIYDKVTYRIYYLKFKIADPHMIFPQMIERIEKERKFADKRDIKDFSIAERFRKCEEQLKDLIIQCDKALEKCEDNE